MSDGDNNKARTTLGWVVITFVTVCTISTCAYLNRPGMEREVEWAGYAVAGLVALAMVWVAARFVRRAARTIVASTKRGWESSPSETVLSWMIVGWMVALIFYLFTNEPRGDAYDAYATEQLNRAIRVFFTILAPIAALRISWRSLTKLAGSAPPWFRRCVAMATGKSKTGSNGRKRWWQRANVPAAIIVGVSLIIAAYLYALNGRYTYVNAADGPDYRIDRWTGKTWVKRRSGKGLGYQWEPFNAPAPR